METLHAFMKAIRAQFHWLLIAAGLIIVLSVYLLPYFTNTPVPGADLLNTLATAAISGGVFSTLVNSVMFTEIFRDRLQDVLRSPNFLANLASFADSWETLAEGIYRAKLPELADQMKGALAQRVPNDRTWYYRSYRLVMRVEWDDDERTNARGCGCGGSWISM